MVERYCVKQKGMTRPLAYFSRKSEAEEYALKNSCEVIPFDDYMLFMNWTYPNQKLRVWEQLLQQRDMILIDKRLTPELCQP